MKTRKLPSHSPVRSVEAEVRKCAYYLWEEEGRPAGRDLDIWLTAQELVRYRALVPIAESDGVPRRSRRLPRGPAMSSNPFEGSAAEAAAVFEKETKVAARA